MTDDIEVSYQDIMGADPAELRYIAEKLNTINTAQVDVNADPDTLRAALLRALEAMVRHGRTVTQ